MESTKELEISEAIKELVAKRELHTKMVSKPHISTYRKELVEFNRTILSIYEATETPYEREPIKNARGRYATTFFVVRASEDLMVHMLSSDIKKSHENEIPSFIRNAIKPLLSLMEVYRYWNIDPADKKYRDIVLPQTKVEEKTEFLLASFGLSVYRTNLYEEYYKYDRSISQTNKINEQITSNIKYLLALFGVPYANLKKNGTEKVIFNLPNQSTLLKEDDLIEIARNMTDLLSMKINPYALLFGTEKYLIEADKRSATNTVVSPLDTLNDISGREQDLRKQIFDEKFFDDYPMFTSLRCIYDDIAVTEKEKSFIGKVMDQYLQEFSK
jgi:hypothetical protein